MSALCGRVRPLRPKLSTVPLWIPSEHRRQDGLSILWVVLMLLALDMSILLQQHQDDDERSMSSLSKTVRRQEHRVETNYTRGVR